jgi:hypothetical protein
MLMQLNSAEKNLKDFFNVHGKVTGIFTIMDVLRRANRFTVSKMLLPRASKTKIQARNHIKNFTNACENQNEPKQAFL